MRQVLVVTLALVTSLLGSSLCAQDTRDVSEPKIPPTCTVLKARLTTVLSLEDEGKLDTGRIQNALDGCAKGHAVELAADGGNDAFLTGPIQLRSGVTLLIDRGVTLMGSRNARDYDIEPGLCGINSPKVGCVALITGKNIVSAGIMGEGVIDGRGAAKILNAGKETGRSWWDLGHMAKTAGHQQTPRLIVLDEADSFTLYNVTLRNSPFFHVTYNNGNGLTVWGMKIDTPADAPNTDGIDPGGSKNITITHTYVRTGDDNIAIKGGKAVSNMTVSHNHFYSGHGMSIGSETTGGVSAIRVTDLSLDGTTSGIRIKSQQAYGGHVHDIVYEDVCIRDSKTPIDFDTNYTANPKPGGGLVPVFDNIALRNVRIEGGGKIKLRGFDANHKIGVVFDGVTVDTPAKYKFDIQHTDLTLGPGAVNFRPSLASGDDSTETGSPRNVHLPTCTAKFVPFPQQH